MTTTNLTLALAALALLAHAPVAAAQTAAPPGAATTRSDGELSPDERRRIARVRARHAAGAAGIEAQARRASMPEATAAPGQAPGRGSAPGRAPEARTASAHRHAGGRHARLADATRRPEPPRPAGEPSGALRRYLTIEDVTEHRPRGETVYRRTVTRRFGPAAAGPEAAGVAEPVEEDEIRIGPRPPWRP